MTEVFAVVVTVPLCSDDVVFAVAVAAGAVTEDVTAADEGAVVTSVYDVEEVVSAIIISGS